jgi:hypothetical protein
MQHLQKLPEARSQKPLPFRSGRAVVQTTDLRAVQSSRFPLPASRFPPSAPPGAAVAVGQGQGAGGGPRGSLPDLALAPLGPIYGLGAKRCCKLATSLLFAPKPINTNPRSDVAQPYVLLS